MGVVVLGREMEREQGLYPLDVLRDLGGIGHLIDTAFADDIAQDGSQFLQDLSLLTLASPAMWALRRISSDMRDAFDGFVWLDDGQVVGNVTLTRDDAQRRVWTVSNVAVHPDHRRRGIAHSLMEATLDAVAERGGGVVTLQVKANNQAAYEMYKNLGFQHVDGVAAARLSAPLSAPLPLAGSARRVRDQEWHKVYDLLMATRAPLADRLSPLRRSDYDRPFVRRLADKLGDMWYQEQHFWLAVEEAGRFLAAARLHLRPSGHSSIHLSIHPDGREGASHGLVQTAVQTAAVPHRRLTIHVSSDEHGVRGALRQLGFTELRDLHRLMIDIP
jgi:ribosomal protein S18 acetylase RimI-like enzyme